MNTTSRLLVAALLATLAACGNKGPLVQADSPEAQGAEATPATTEAAPPAGEAEPATTPTETPVDTTSQTPVEPPVDETEPTPADPVEPPVEDDGDP